MEDKQKKAKFKKPKKIKIIRSPRKLKKISNFPSDCMTHNKQ